MRFNRYALLLVRRVAPTLVLLGASAFAGAANNGNVGATSQGSLGISMTVAPQIRAAAVPDLPLSQHRISGPAAQTGICIYSRTGQYQLTASGSGSDSTFALQQPMTSLPFTVNYDDGTGPQQLLPGVALRMLRGADQLSPSCTNSGTSGQLQVAMAPVPQSHLTTDPYIGTLTLLIAPE